MVQIPARQEIFLYSRVSSPAFEANPPPIQ